MTGPQNDWRWWHLFEGVFDQIFELVIRAIFRLVWECLCAVFDNLL